MNLGSLAAFLRDRKEPAFRLKQAKQAFFVDLLPGWEAVTVYAKPLREAATVAVPWDELNLVNRLESPDHDTVKFLFACADQAKIETVIMRHEDERNTVCISSQVGCPMKCSFCATGKLGFTRNLTRWEIAEQVIQAARYLKEMKARVTNVVVMGMGEPFHNYDEVLGALRLLNEADSFNLGARHMSVSTCGIVPGILRLADEQFQINLAISLHAANDALRSRIMPVNNAYPIPKLMRAVATYMEKTNRKVMFEYVLLDGVNDSKEDAEALADLLEPMARLAHVNLIKYHPTKTYHATERTGRISFLNFLQRRGISATYRVSFGEEIDAGCGQLAAKVSRKP